MKCIERDRRYLLVTDLIEYPDYGFVIHAADSVGEMRGWIHENYRDPEMTQLLAMVDAVGQVAGMDVN